MIESVFGFDFIHWRLVFDLNGKMMRGRCAEFSE